MDSKKDAKEFSVFVENSTETCNHVGGKSYHMLQEHGPAQSGNVDADPKKTERQDSSVLNAHEQNFEASSFAGDESVTIRTILINQPEAVKVCNGDHIQDCSKGGRETTDGKLFRQDAVAELGATCRKKKKRRKEHPLPCPEGTSGKVSPNMGNENTCAPFFIKELPIVLKLNSAKEGELRPKKKTKFADEKVTKKNSKKPMVETDPNVGLMQEQDQDNSTKEFADMNDKERLLNVGLVESSSARFPPKEFSQEGLVKTKPSFNVFDYESSETVNRSKETCTNTEVTSNPEADNLEKLCSVAVKLVEEDILNSSKMAIRKSSRKSVHPKRWITVLSERLTWNRTTKHNLKKQHASKKGKPTAEGTWHTYFSNSLLYFYQ
ncbi:hypothetical protein L7F22_025704 [Adiantum nelumboides]|nr:hypothetical protein [Adiantum nelumboides]